MSAAAFLAADEWTTQALVTCGARALGARPPWLRKTAATVARVFATPPRDRIHTLARFIARDANVRDACANGEAPHPTVPRARYDQIRAILHNCARWSIVANETIELD